MDRSKQAEEIASEQPQQEAPKFDPEAKIKEAQKLVSTTDKVVLEKKYPPKEDVKPLYATIVTALLIKAKQSKNEMLDMNEEFSKN